MAWSKGERSTGAATGEVREERHRRGEEERLRRRRATRILREGEGGGDAPSGALPSSLGLLVPRNRALRAKAGGPRQLGHTGRALIALRELFALVAARSNSSGRARLSRSHLAKHGRNERRFVSDGSCQLLTVALAQVG